MAEWLLIAASEAVAPVKGVASAAFHIMTPVTVTAVAIPKTSNIFDIVVSSAKFRLPRAAITPPPLLGLCQSPR